MGNIKKFVGEYAYNIIKNITVDNDALRRALITPQNAREVFKDLNEFEIKALCTEISNNGILGQVKNATKAEIIEAFNSIGYDKVIFDDETEISECKKYYSRGEVICTYKNLQSRMMDYHMLVVVKTDIDKIERAKNPRRDDEYGTSILNIQIARNGLHMSIKNRYNHTVSEPDSTLNNNLDILYLGLQSMVLGYYGFANLTRQKVRYNNVTNIGNVYLKYHTERDNIYFGSFILDGVYGARYTDTSRYYVTKGEKSNYYNHPLVLDFKDKKAIDVLQNKTQSNVKASLLTRAMQEGVLSSGNKKEADTLTAVFQNAKKELLLNKKTTLKYIHEAYGYNFTKPFKVTGFLGKFTANSIEKVTGSSEGILLVYSKEKISAVVLNMGGFNIRELVNSYKYNIGKFYTKGEFEDMRKSGTAAAFLIQQEKQYIGEPKPEVRESYYFGRSDRKPEIDKSGYNVTEAREELYRKLQQYKKVKRAKEAAEVDYIQDIAEITNSFAKLKSDIITSLTKAETFNDYEKLDNVTDCNLTWLVRDIENVKKQAAEKSFTSISSAKIMIEKVKETIIKLNLKLVS